MFLALILRSYLRTGKIKNSLVFTFMAGGVILNTCCYGMIGLNRALEGVLLIVFAGWGFYTAGLLGAGDIKTLAVTGSLMGPSFVGGVFIKAILCGGAAGLVILLIDRDRKSRFPLLAAYLKSCFLCRSLPPFPFRQGQGENGAQRLRFPFIVAVLCGVLICLLQDVSWDNYY